MKKIFFKNTVPPGAYEIETVNNELKRLVIDKGFYTEADFPVTIKPNFSTLVSIVEIMPQGAIIGFVIDDSI